LETNEISIFNGKKLKAGDCIELCDIIGDKYKQTKHYDVNIENPIDLFKRDDSDFKYVEIIPIESEFSSKAFDVEIKAHKLLSKFRDKIQYFEIVSTGSIAVTRYFKIEIDEAIENNEVRIIEGNCELTDQHREEELIENIQEVHEFYSIGLLDEKEFRNSLIVHKHFYFHLQKKWNIKYGQSITGKYYKIKD